MAKKKVTNEDVMRKLEALEKLVKEQGPKPDPLEAVRKLAEELNKQNIRHEIYIPQPYPVYPYPLQPQWWIYTSGETASNSYTVSSSPNDQWTYTTLGQTNG